jgi:hypothetical protein
MDKHPEFAELSEKLRGLCSTLEGDFWEDNIQRPLYEAYVVMCSYVEKDWELFQSLSAIHPTDAKRVSFLFKVY